MTIPKTSQGKLRISILAGTRFCTFNGNSIRAVQKGRCTIAVTMVPKRGRTFTRQTTITVR
jgi:prophage maintenance system killer protein